MKKHEYRSFKIDEIAVRQADGEPTRIVGHAAVFNEETVIGSFFRERVAPGAFSRALKESQDVRALFNHDPSAVLGRTKSGTLRLAEDDRGLAVEITAPDTTVARDLVAQIDRGDVDQMSFGFKVVEDEWDESETKDGKLPLRTLRDVDLFDVSVVTFPAYEGTKAEAKSAELVFAEHRSKAAETEIEREEIEREEKLAGIGVVNEPD